MEEARSCGDGARIPDREFLKNCQQKAVSRRRCAREFSPAPRTGGPTRSRRARPPRNRPGWARFAVGHRGEVSLRSRDCTDGICARPEVWRCETRARPKTRAVRATSAIYGGEQLVRRAAADSGWRAPPAMTVSATCCRPVRGRKEVDEKSTTRIERCSMAGASTPKPSRARCGCRGGSQKKGATPADDR